MTDSNSSVDLNKWLDEQSLFVVKVIAVRSVIRSFICFPGSPERLLTYPHDLLGGLHGLAVAWESLFGILITDKGHAHFRQWRETIAEELYKAIDAVRLATVIDSEAPDNARKALDSSLNRGDDSETIQLLQEMAEDSAQIDAGKSPYMLAIDPLFLIGNGFAVGAFGANAIDELPDEHLAQWRALRRVLQESEKGWEVWIDWIEHRILGAPPNQLFTGALGALSESEWQREPVEVNALLAARMNAGRHPAVSVFDLVKGRIEGRAYPVDLAQEEQLSLAAYEELKHQFGKLADTLRQFDDHPVTRDILDDVRRIVAQLGAKFENVEPGRLLLQLDMLLAAELRIAAVRSDHQQSLPAHLEPNVRQVHNQLKRFLGLYDHRLRAINDRAESLGLKLADVEFVHALHAESVAAAEKASEQVVASAITALKVGFPEYEKLTLQIRGEMDPERRTRLEGMRALEAARGSRNLQNFIEVVIVAADAEKKEVKETGVGKKLADAVIGGTVEGLKDGFKKTVSGAIVFSFSALAASLWGPIAGIAALVASFPNVVEKLKAASENK